MAKHKYISQDAAIDAVDVCNLHRGIIDALQAIISDIPSADVVEVVRCRDCYAYRRDPELAKAANLDPKQYCALLRCEFPSDGFCSYGRRADNG